MDIDFISLKYSALHAFILSITFGNLACSQNASSQRTPREAEVVITELAADLNHPWGMAFLPNGDLLITERNGQLRVLKTNGNVSKPIEGVPEVYDRGQGGLLDVALHPDFEANKMLYLVFSEPGANNTASTALGMGKLENNTLQNFEVIFSQQPKVKGPNHFGGRVVIDGDKLFLTMGERFKFEPAQDLSNHLGTIVRLNLDGSIPSDNPFVNDPPAKPEIYSYGNRNIESADIDPATGNLWVAEFGPRGGDELNLIQPGKNYGWPVVSWGNNYDGSKIPDPPTHPEFEDAIIHWTPVISPSGMQFYTGSMFPNWQGHMLIGGLSSQALIIVEVNGTRAKEVDRIDMNARIRDVQQAPDGSIYVLTDDSNGKVLRLSRK